jgi:hypothetical protein
VKTCPLSTLEARRKPLGIRWSRRTPNRADTLPAGAHGRRRFCGPAKPPQVRSRPQKSPSRNLRNASRGVKSLWPGNSPFSAEILPTNQNQKVRPAYASSNPLSPATQSRQSRELRSPGKSPGIPRVCGGHLHPETGNSPFLAKSAGQLGLSLRSAFRNLRNLANNEREAPRSRRPAPVTLEDPTIKPTWITRVLLNASLDRMDGAYFSSDASLSCSSWSLLPKSTISRCKLPLN